MTAAAAVEAPRDEFIVRGAHCANCMRKIETAALDVHGVANARLNLSTERLTVHWAGDRRPAPELIVSTLNELGYPTTPFDAETSGLAADAEGRDLLRCLGVAAFASMNVMLFSVPVWAGFGEMGDATRTTFYWIGALIAVPAALYAGRPFFRSAINALRHGRANMDVPISLGVLLTLVVSIIETVNGGLHSYFDGAVGLLFLLLIGRNLDHNLRQRARGAAKALLAMNAVQARRLSADGTTALVHARDLLVGDQLILRPGERAPVNCVVIEGASDVDRSFITGESAPSLANVGARLHAGVINLTAALVVRATSTVETSLIGDLARLIEQGEQRRDKYVQIADIAARLYVPIVHTLALGTFLGWLFIGDAGLRQALLIAVTVLIITCPCALGLAAPAVQVVATGALFKRGIFVRAPDALERLAEIDVVFLDKTGTVTLGEPEVVQRHTIDPDALERAAQLARASKHPYSRAVAAAAGTGVVAAGAREIPGAGIEADIDGKRARLGSRVFAASRATTPDDGQSELWFSWGDDPPTRLVVADKPRPDAAAVIQEMERRGLRPCLISGDTPHAVANVARSLGLTRFEAALTPAQKVARVESARAQGLRVLMIGDGLNDAAALAAAHASASPGTAVDATQAAADIVFRGTELGAVLDALEVSKKARARLLENFTFAALYNICAIPVAIAGGVTPLIAALAMAGSSLVVTLNAMRLAIRERRPWTR